MKITRAQFQKLRQICSKFGVSPDQIQFKKVVLVGKQKLPRRRIILTSDLRFCHHKSCVRYNVLKRIDLRQRLYHPEKVQRWKPKRRTIAWRKAQRIVNRQLAAAAKATCVIEDTTSEEGENVPDTSQLKSQEVVRDQIKTQLHLLQQGRRKSVHLGEDDENGDAKDESKSK